MAESQTRRGDPLYAIAGLAPDSRLSALGLLWHWKCISRATAFHVPLVS
jgi:hypothetical protein